MSVQVGDRVSFSRGGSVATGVVRGVNKVTLDVMVDGGNDAVRVRTDSVTVVQEETSTHNEVGIRKASRFSHKGDNDGTDVLSVGDTGGDHLDSANQEAGVVGQGVD